jgi:hypothetical protein
MPLHVRITLRSDSFRDRVMLDLDEQQLRRHVLDPYLAGLPFMVDGEAIDPYDIKMLRVNETTQLSAQLLPQIAAERRASRAVTILPDEWHVTQRGDDVTQSWVTRPAGDAARDSIATPDAVDLIVNICRRLDRVARRLSRRHADRPTLVVGDEYDVQDLLHALLAVHFDDIRSESPNPTFLGGSSRPDFLLPDAKILIEVKKARAGLGDRQIGNELAEDVTRYADPSAGHHATTLVCFVYDPQRLLNNPDGLEKDLAATSTDRLKVVGVVG